MDSLDRYREAIREILIGHTKVPFAHGEIGLEPVIDRDADRYLLMIVGRQNGRRVHGCLVHMDIIDGKIWIQRDGTEVGIANELVAAGVPKDQIVLGFRSMEMRKDTEFAVA